MLLLCTVAFVRICREYEVKVALGVSLLLVLSLAAIAVVKDVHVPTMLYITSVTFPLGLGIQAFRWRRQNETNRRLVKAVKKLRNRRS